MNRENFNRLIENYIEKYDELNNAENNEIYKWVAIYRFQKEWDIDAADFGEMFKEATKDAFNIINNKTVQPAAAIPVLCKLSTEIMEIVREEFKKLLASDNGNIKERQGKIDTFISNINILLEKEFPGKWKYEQDRRAVIDYLAFIDPENNYLFKATEVKAYADCVEFGDDIGSGQNFRLDHYYRMCDELVSELQNNEEICTLLDDRLSEEEANDGNEGIVDMPGKFNILAYDVMYCADTYNLYNNIQVVKKTKVAASSQKAQDKKDKEEALIAKKTALEEEVKALEEEIGIQSIPGVTFLDVNHARFGSGTVASQDGNYISVDFSGVFKKFRLPDAIGNGFLKTDNEEVNEICRKSTELMAKQEELKRDIQLVQIEISKL